MFGVLKAKYNGKMNLQIFVVAEKYLKMPLDTKRTGYKCGKNFTTLDNIETWASMFQNMEDTFKLNTDKTQKHHDAGEYIMI